jgi:hypothetical protein
MVHVGRSKPASKGAFAFGVVLVAVVPLLLAAGCGATIDVGPTARALAPAVTTVVALPTSVDWGGPGDQRRLQRRVGDRLLELTGGRAVIAEELVRGDDDASVRDALRVLGEDAASAVSFSIRIGIGKRLVNNANPISSFQATRRLVVEFSARLEVRHLGSSEVIGSVEAVSSGPANEPEVGSDGRRAGPLLAIDEVLEAAVRAFAPRLASPPRPTLVVEVPVAAAGDVVKRLAALAELYPELPAEDMQRLAESRERFLVVAAGPLAAIGLRPGDRLGVPGGQSAASHAALARAVARGRKPLLAIDRGGQHYLLAGGPG